MYHCRKLLKISIYHDIYSKISILESGQIRNVDYGNGEDLFWPINSNCETVHILSTFFKTESYWDKVIIDRIEHSGDKNVNQIVSTNFTVEFLSDGSITDEGFILNWNCTQWGEWTHRIDESGKDHHPDAHDRAF